MTECRIKILYHLAALNDQYKEIHRRETAISTHRQRILDVFNIEANLDESASLEGYASRKATFTFQFLNDSNSLENVCCEPHLKLPYNDSEDGSYSCGRRIHFHEGKMNRANGRILIGHIGRHL